MNEDLYDDLKQDYHIKQMLKSRNALFSWHTAQLNGSELQLENIL